MRKKCLVCKKLFYRRPSIAMLPSTKFCSRPCKYRFEKLTGWNKRPINKLKKTCLSCQKIFEIWPARKETAKFCSRDCYTKSLIGKIPRPEFNLSDEERRRRGINGTLKQSRAKEPTSIEKKVYEELMNRGFLFETQKLINGRFIVDAYIPSLNLIIEADGDYWHSLDRVIKKDKAENAYLKKCGYSLLRLSETEIKNGEFRKKLVV